MLQDLADITILPTPLRLNADPRFTGKGVTICFIDSGFYPHDDLTGKRNRVNVMIDITNAMNGEAYFSKPHPESWHGTMTSVVCAGDGYSSNGLYKGIASDAELVLLKVQNDEGKITTANLERALKWVLAHHEIYNIRIVNMSVADDVPVSYKESRVDALAEALYDRGITVVAAVGNDEHAAIKPPANSPHVIAVGGIDDHNSLEASGHALYHSSYGNTVDGLMKPDLIANAIWIAAPILPGTPEKTEAERLHNELNAADTASLAESIRQRIQSSKYFSPTYMHVDGTSFAAPIVSAVIAQLLEIDPMLNPTQIRRILFSTAKRINNMPAERQGFGYVQARRAVIKALQQKNVSSMSSSPLISNRKNTISFFVQHTCASQISLAGSFNNWVTDALFMEPCNGGVWKIEIPMLPNGKYAYKFLVDEDTWIEDVCNPLREPDGLNGWNSILILNK